MSKLIEDFSVKVPMVNPENGYRYTDFVNLEVMDWNNPVLVAYTMNSHSENTARQLYKALEKYKKLRFVTGVTGRTLDQLIQQSLRKNMEKLYGGKIAIETSSSSYVYQLK